MLKIKKDFYSTFKKAEVAGDTEGQRKIIMSGIATAIRKDKSNVMELLSLTGVKIAPNAHNKEIALAIAQNAGHNEKLQNGLAFLSLKATGSLPRYSNADDKDEEGVPSPLVGMIGGIVGGIGGAVGSIFQSKAESIKAKSIADSNRMALVSELLKQEGNASTNTLFYVLGGLALVTLIFVVVKTSKS